MVAKSAKKTAQPENWSYETTINTVAAVIAELESGQLPLADVIAQFELAVQSLQQCEAYLAEKQQQVDVLIETLKDP